MQDHVEIGPFCHLRPKAFLSSHVHLGNYAEVKNSRLGESVHMGHFSDLGDAEVGAHTNIGAGTITANYDGVTKHKTIIGEGAFIGSDTVIRARQRLAHAPARGQALWLPKIYHRIRSRLASRRGLSASLKMTNDRRRIERLIARVSC